MFDVSWGEVLVLTGVGFALIGKRDLPRAANLVGTQVGRVVGLLQGARARADRFTQTNELRHLHNDLRAGLRELDAVRSEMAIAMSSRGVVGKNLGATVSGVNKSTKQIQPKLAAARPISTTERNSSLQQRTTAETAAQHDGAANIAANVTNIGSSTGEIKNQVLAPQTQTVAAVAEEEWEKQGIAFRSRAEQGLGMGLSAQQSGQQQHNGGQTGSEMLANLVQQTLIFDQYDRVVQEEDNALQSKVDQIQKKVKDKEQ